MTTDHLGDYLSSQQSRKQNLNLYGPLLFKVSVGCCVAGLAVLYFGFTVFAVALLAIGAFCLSGYSHSLLMQDMMDERYYLAQFIATQRAEDMDTIRWELQQQAKQLKDLRGGGSD
ncbi:MAG: hypothetical protein HOP32_14470 [Nitrospira sp.]|nr:hypothetical protein [Nitrospira sp.]